MGRTPKSYTKAELLVKNCEGKSVLEKVQAVAVYILDSENKISPDNTLSTDDILSKYVELKSKSSDIVTLTRNTFIVYLSRLANDDQSFIKCPGKKQGYWYDKNSYELSEGIRLPSPKKVNEKVLYPIVGTWIQLNGYRYVGDVSTKKRLGKWRNPDLLGVNVFSVLGNKCIEIATVEVKNTINDWRRSIFESVAHLMMANRSYFAFLCTPEELEAEHLQMREYALQFGVGLLAVFEDKERGYIVKLIQLAPNHLAKAEEQEAFLHANNLYNESDLETKLKY